MPHVIPGFKGTIHDPIALAKEQFEGKSASQKRDVLDASTILATVRKLSERVEKLEASQAATEKIVDKLLTTG